MIIKTTLHPIILILFSVFAYSQGNDNEEEDLFSKAHWGISIVPALFEKAHIYGERDKYHINTSPQPGGEVLLNYYYHFERNCSLVFSTGGSIIGNNFNYEVAKEFFNPPTAANVSSLGSEMSCFNIKTQVEMQINFAERQKKSWLAAAGMSVLYSIDSPWEFIGFIYFGGISSQNSQEYLHIDQMYDNGNKPWVNFHISGGHAWGLKRGNLLQAALKLNYSPVDFAVGIYNFHVGNQPDVIGEYKLSGSYIGLSLSYIFSRRRI